MDPSWIPASELLAAIGTVNVPGDSGAGPKPPLCTSAPFGMGKSNGPAGVDYQCP